MLTFSFSRTQKIIILVEVLLLGTGAYGFALDPDRIRPAAVLAPAVDEEPAESDELPGEEAARGPAGPVNINTAGVEELDRIKGVGTTMAKDIYAYRVGPDGVAGTDDDNLFNPAEELDMVKGISVAKLAKILPQVTCGDTSAIPPWLPPGSAIVNINTASVEELAGLPKVGEGTAQKIVDYRNGPDGVEGTADDRKFYTVDDLDNVPGFSAAKIETLRARATVGNVTGGPPTTAAAADAKVDLSTATAEELERLPGVGGTMAANIVAYRERVGGFASVDDLDNVERIGPPLIARLRDLVTISRPRTATATPATPATTTATTTPVTGTGGQVNINRATAAELEALPGIGASTAEKIVKYRQEHGQFQRLEDIMQVPGIGQGTYNKFKDRITL